MAGRFSPAAPHALAVHARITLGRDAEPAQDAALLTLTRRRHQKPQTRRSRRAIGSRRRLLHYGYAGRLPWGAPGTCSAQAGTGGSLDPAGLAADRSSTTQNWAGVLVTDRNYNLSTDARAGKRKGS